jgi:hypothetical protein
MGNGASAEAMSTTLIENALISSSAGELQAVLAALPPADKSKLIAALSENPAKPQRLTGTGVSASTIALIEAAIIASSPGELQTALASLPPADRTKLTAAIKAAGATARRAPTEGKLLKALASFDVDDSGALSKEAIVEILQRGDGQAVFSHEEALRAADRLVMVFGRSGKSEVHYGAFASSWASRSRAARAARG